MEIIQLLNKNIDNIKSIMRSDLELRNEIIKDIISIGDFKIELSDYIDEIDIDNANVYYDDGDGYTIMDIYIIEVENNELYVTIANEYNEIKISVYNMSFNELNSYLNILEIIVEYLELTN